MQKNKNKLEVEQKVLNKQAVNPFDYGYTNDQVETIPLNDLMTILAYAVKVKESQPQLAVLYDYPETVDNVLGEDGELLESNVKWSNHTAKSFFKSVNNPVNIATPLSIMSDQIIFGLQQIHEKNINSGIAKPMKEVSEAEVFKTVRTDEV